ncbi:DUF1727 domain-containing protein [Candidatus Dojkabacteria bacterium]|uniref:Lipid II isoglutaminyl synthase (glutamine-hydrolyzing) subunit MurT n=1 Tax=Candidatus Dojkabacteria bacterium TaxID=2099670 RepID=A0A955L762_9BACT|nr:DUF1727 domain-containing protein [Candidatus Dojkabacteria bacterium]
MKQIAIVPIVIFAKILTWIVKVTKRGSGTALPGLIVGRRAPWVLSYLLEQIPHIIVVTGTNGKTTTQTMLRSIIETDNQVVLTNATGANLSRGILSELLKRSNILGKISFKSALFEVEEGTLPRIVAQLKPEIIAVTNLYRDQLDAYGEIDITEKYIRTALEKAPQARIVLNQDDPRVSKLAQGLPNEVVYVSLPEELLTHFPYEGIQSKKTKPHKQSVKAKSIQIHEDLTSEFSVEGKVGDNPITIEDIRIASPGFFHVYNALVAITIASLIKIKPETIKAGLQNFEPAFGRGEVIMKKEGTKAVHYRLLLVKNPAGFNLNTQLIQAIPNLKILIAINDNTADGTDVSWLWDSKLEILNESSISSITCSGTRAKDMHLRLKYAFNILPEIHTDESLDWALQHTFETAKHGDTIFVLPTYTAMLEIRKLMGRQLEE